MKKNIRLWLPEIIFFCVTFAVLTIILQSHFTFFSEVIGTFLLKFGLHFSYWSGFNRSCVMFLADFLSAILIFLIARYTCGIQKNSGKRKLITVSVLVFFSLVMLGILCELQVFRRDDFWEVQYSKDLGLMKFLKHVFTVEGGRYFSYILKGCNIFFPTAAGSMYYMNTCLLISLLGLLTGLYRLLLLLFKTSVSANPSLSEKKTAFFLAFCLFSAFVFTSPKIWEDWFWDAGGLIFGIGISLSVWSFVLVVEDVLYNNGRRKKMILPSLVLFLACGCNQISTLAIDILISEALLYVLLSRPNLRIKRRVLYYFFLTVAASMICMLAPGNFYRLEYGPFESERLSETGILLRQLFLRLYQQISVNIVMMKTYWILLITVCFLIGLITELRNKKRMILLSVGLFPAGFFSLSFNYLINYMPARIYAAAFLWIALPAGLLSVVLGSLLHDSLKKNVLPVRIQSAYVFLAVFVSFCPVFFLYNENHQLLLDIRSAWFYRDEQIRCVQASQDQTRRICGVPIIGTNGTDIKLAEAFIANYYRLGWVEDSGVCPPFIPFSDDPAIWR